VLGAVHADRRPQLTGPYTELDPFHDPFVMFAYLAAVTERIQFTTGILVLPQRQTRSWLGRRPMLISCRAVGCASGWGLAGTTSSTRPLGRLPNPRRQAGGADQVASPVVYRTCGRLPGPLRPG
jgi:hypothetical protein